MNEEKIGIVSHYYNKIGVAIIALEGSLSIKDTVHMKGITTDFTQKIDSMQFKHKNIESAKEGDSIGIKVNEYTREDAAAYKVVEE